MEYVSIQEAMEKGEGSVNVRGWVYRVRKSNKFIFIVLRDASNNVQCIVSKEGVDEKIWEAASKATMEASLMITGDIRPDERAPTGFEVDVKDITIVGVSDTFPISKDFSPEFLLDVRHLWNRSKKMTNIMKVKATILEAGREWFKQHKWYETTPPIITKSSCEGGSTLFEIKYFKEVAYLSQSAQLYLESLIYSLGGVYALTPSFRAEKSNTPRHLAEYWHLEGEAAWMDFEGLLSFIEGMIAYMAKTVVERNEKELKELGRDPADLLKIKAPFHRMSYKEALAKLKEGGMEVPYGKDLRTLEENKLMEGLDRPMMVTQYPKDIKAFYMKEDPEDSDLVLCCDMLAPEEIGEIIGCSERETDYDEIVRKLEEEGEDIANYGWYLDLRKYGSVPHSGFGIGVERIVRWFCKLDTIKDAIPFPRTITRSYP